MSERFFKHDRSGAVAAAGSAAEAAAQAFHERARLAEERLAEVLAAYRTLKTENEGYRDRVTRNLEQRFDRKRERLLLRFIDILDNLDRALEAAELTYAGNPLIEGLILVRTQLLQALQEEGLERIPVVGLPYDPAVSEAVETQPVDDPDEHHLVLKDLQRGYRLNGRVVRASRTLVAEYRRPGTAAEAPPTAAPAEPPHEEELTLSGLRLEGSLLDPGAVLEELLARAPEPEAPPEPAPAPAESQPDEGEGQG